MAPCVWVVHRFETDAGCGGYGSLLTACTSGCGASRGRQRACWRPTWGHRRRRRQKSRDTTHGRFALKLETTAWACGGTMVGVRATDKLRLCLCSPVCSGERLCSVVFCSCLRDVLPAPTMHAGVCVCVCVCVCVHAPLRAPIKHTQYQNAVASGTFTKTIWVCGPRTLQQITNPQARHAHSCVVASPSGLLVGVADGVGDLLLVDVHKHRLHALRVGRHRHLHAEHICWGNIGRLWWYAQREHNLHHKAWRVRPDVGIVGIGTCNRHGHRTFSGGGGLRMNLDPPGMYGTT